MNSLKPLLIGAIAAPIVYGLLNGAIEFATGTLKFLVKLPMWILYGTGFSAGAIMACFAIIFATIMVVARWPR